MMRSPLLLVSPSARRRALVFGVATLTTLACAGHSDRETLAELRNRQPDLREAPIDNGLEQAMAGYRKFLAEAPKSSLTPEAMRRLADLKLEQEFGLLGGPSAAPGTAADLTQPERATSPKPAEARTRPSNLAAIGSFEGETAAALEARIASTSPEILSEATTSLTLPGGGAAETDGPLEAIKLYDEILAGYPDYAQTDQVLYQKARALDELGRVDEAVEVAALLVSQYPHSRHIDEIQFRRGEYFFTRKQYLTAEQAYSAIIDHGPESSYYELALYKLGWSFYKQMMLDEALESYVSLLDHKVSGGYDFDQAKDETEEQRVADTYRVMSLCFSDLGGAEAVTRFFEAKGSRTYEDRVYRHLGEFYLEKRRYNDAASTYEAFIDLNPTHKISPHFSMRVVEIYEAGNFPKLVLTAKKNFAANYGLDSAYWAHFKPENAPEVLDYLKGNLEDLANHYHALYQNTDRVEDKPAHFTEGVFWYRAFLSSFPAAPETAGIHYQLADLLLQNEDFSRAAVEYEHLAYDYPPHQRSSSAGYAAIFAHRKFEGQIPESGREGARRESVASTLRFVDAFPNHEHAAAVLGAAIDDLYDLEEYALAIANGRRLLADYRESTAAIRRAAWTVIAHASFDTEAFVEAEQAYAQVLTLTTTDDPSIVAVVNNLAAAIYKQGEEATRAQDFRAAADHYLRIGSAAPSSDIRPIAEYDAAAALIQLKDWSGAAKVLESFRRSFPEHELSREATQQIAFVYREDGNPARAAEEYERVASEATESDLRREALLVAAELYEEAQLIPKALDIYGLYVTEFTKPIEPAVVARFKMAELYDKTGNEPARRAELERIVAIDRNAGEARTDVVRLHAGRSALILSETAYTVFAEVELTLPFEKSLALKKKRMNSALATFGRLVDYEVGEVTAAATFYMAEIYSEFSRALMASERPGDLDANDLDEYEAVLEEEAFPFEEKAIVVHEKNLELMRGGVFNAWIEKSLSKLAVSMPGRYAKFDSSGGLIESMTSYSYQSPRSLIPVAPELDIVGTAESEPPTTQVVAEESVAEAIVAPSPVTDANEAQEPVPAAPAFTDTADSAATNPQPDAVLDAESRPQPPEEAGTQERDL